MPSTLWEATLISSVVTDAAPERNAGAIGSLHAELSTRLGQILSHHLLDQVYQQGRGNSLQML